MTRSSAALLLPLCAFAAFALQLAAPSAAFGWGRQMHRVIADVAMNYLTPEAKAEVAKLAPRGLAPLANWADRVIPKRPQSAPWHYVNIPLAVRRYKAARDCVGGDCAVQAIERFKSVLHRPNATKKARLDALRFLVHFVADLNQPLHAEDNDDRGGNKVKVTLFGKETNLHAVWDYGLFERGRPSRARLRTDLEAWVGSHPSAKRGVGGPVAWANEAHALAQGAYVLPADHALGAEYVAVNRPIAEEQAAKAAVRLGKILNQAFAARKRSPAGR